MKLAFRAPANDDDRTFVVESMLENQRTSYSAGLVPMDDWFTSMRPHFTKLLARDGMRTVIAYEADDPEFLYGWMAADPTEQRVTERDGSVRWWPALVLYVFVKANFRRAGIARRLFAAVGVDPEKPFLFSCNTRQASRLSHKTPLARFNPLAVRFSKEPRAEFSR